MSEGGVPARVGQVAVAVDGASHQGLEQRRRPHGQAGAGNDEHRRARTPKQQAARHGGHDQRRRSRGLPQEVHGQSDVPPRRPHTVRRRPDDPRVHHCRARCRRHTGPRARRPPARRGPRSARAARAATGAAPRAPAGRSHAHRVRSSRAAAHPAVRTSSPRTRRRRRWRGGRTARRGRRTAAASHAAAVGPHTPRTVAAHLTDAMHPSPPLTADAMSPPVDTATPPPEPPAAAPRQARRPATVSGAAAGRIRQTNVRRPG